MRNKFQKVIRGLRTERLTIEEKQAMRNVLLQTIREKSPLSTPWRTISPFSFYWSISIRQMRTAVAVILVLVSVGAPFVYAAENALPGNFLYAIKTNFNEPIRRFAISSSASAGARYETFLLERRLTEAEELDDAELFESPRLQEKVAEGIKLQKAKAEKAFSVTRKKDPGGIVNVTVKIVEGEKPSVQIDRVPNVEASLLVEGSIPGQDVSLEATRAEEIVVQEATNSISFSLPEKGRDQQEVEAVLEKHGEIVSKLKIGKEHQGPPGTLLE